MSKLTRHPPKKTRSKEQKTCFIFFVRGGVNDLNDEKTKKIPTQLSHILELPICEYDLLFDAALSFALLVVEIKKYQIPKKCFVFLCLSDISFSAVVVVSCCESRCKNRKETLSLPRSHKKTSFFPGAKRLIAPTEKKRRKRNANIFLPLPLFMVSRNFCRGGNEGKGGNKCLSSIAAKNVGRERELHFFAAPLFTPLFLCPLLITTEELFPFPIKCAAAKRLLQTGYHVSALPCLFKRMDGETDVSDCRH